MVLTHEDKDVPLCKVGEQDKGEDDGKPNCYSHLRVIHISFVIFLLHF